MVVDASAAAVVIAPVGTVTGAVGPDSLRIRVRMNPSVAQLLLATVVNAVTRISVERVC